MRPRFSHLLLVAALLALAPAALAQPAPPSAGSGAAADRREQIKRKLLALRAYRLTEELALDETSAARVFPVLAKYDPQLEQLIIERAAMAKELRAGPTGPAAEDLVNRAVANRRALFELEEKRLAELRKVLTSRQTARLLVVLPEIETQLKQQIRRAVRNRGGSQELLDPFDRPFDRPVNRPAKRRNKRAEQLE